MKVLAYDIETRLTAAEVAEKYAEELGGVSSWTRPDYFEYGCAVVQDVESGAIERFGEYEDLDLLGTLAQADLVVSYNGAAFDLEVLRGVVLNMLDGAKPDPVEAIRRKHVDIYVLVRDALDALPASLDRQGAGRVRQGGLDDLARANGLSGKTGQGADVPAMLQEGRVEEALAYCERDVRLVSFLYRMARRAGKLRVEPYVLGEDGEKVYLDKVELDVAAALGRALKRARRARV